MYKQEVTKVVNLLKMAENSPSVSVPLNCALRFSKNATETMDNVKQKGVLEHMWKADLNSPTYPHS